MVLHLTSALLCDPSAGLLDFVVFTYTVSWKIMASSSSWLTRIRWENNVLERPRTPQSHVTRSFIQLYKAELPIATMDTHICARPCSDWVRDTGQSLPTRIYFQPSYKSSNRTGVWFKTSLHTQSCKTHLKTENKNKQTNQSAMVTSFSGVERTLEFPQDHRL